MNDRRALWGTVRFYFEQLILRHPGWLVVHAIVILHFILNYQLGLMFAWLLLSSLPLLSANLLPVHLPVPRRLVFALSMLPSWLVLVAALGITLAQTQSRGIGQGDEVELRGTPVSFEPRHEARSEARVLTAPAHLWRLSWGPPAPIHLEETSTEPQSVQLVGSLYAYNPFSVSLGDDSALIGRQLSSALKACCDLDVSPAQAAVHAHYAETGGLDSLYEAARRLQRMPVSMLALQFWLTILALLITVRLLCGAKAADRPSLLSKTYATRLILGATVLASAALYLGFLASQAVPTGRIWKPLLVVQVVFAQVAHLASLVPWLFAPLAVVSLWLGYRWTAFHYSRLELPARPMQFFAVRRSSDA